MYGVMNESWGWGAIRAFHGSWTRICTPLHPWFAQPDTDESVTGCILFMHPRSPSAQWSSPPFNLHSVCCLFTFSVLNSPGICFSIYYHCLVDVFVCQITFLLTARFFQPYNVCVYLVNFIGSLIVLVWCVFPLLFILSRRTSPIRV